MKTLDLDLFFFSLLKRIVRIYNLRIFQEARHNDGKLVLVFFPFFFLPIYKQNSRFSNHLINLLMKRLFSLSIIIIIYYFKNITTIFEVFLKKSLYFRNRNIDNKKGNLINIYVQKYISYFSIFKTASLSCSLCEFFISNFKFIPAFFLNFLMNKIIIHWTRYTRIHKSSRFTCSVQFSEFINSII